MNGYLRFAPLLLLAGGVMMSPNLNCQGPGPVDPIAQDVLGQCYAKDRASKVSMLRVMAQEAYPNDAAKAAAWNASTDSARANDYREFIEQELAPAFANNTLKELADKLEAQR